MRKDKLYHLIAGFAIALLIGLFSPIVGIITTIAEQRKLYGTFY